jgi:microcin C transport system substrate-binding protein
LLSPFKDSLPLETLAAEFKLPVNNSQDDVRANLLAAKQLLADAGLKVDGGKLKTANGQPFKIEFLINSPSFERVIAPYIKNLKTLGIEANIRMVDSAQYQTRMDRYDFDMTVLSIGQSLSPGNEQIAYWHSSKADVEGGQNYAGIKNKAVDAMVEKIVSASSRQELINACRAMDRILLNEYYAVPNWHIRTHRLAYWDKFGRPKTNPKYGLPLAESWWVKEEQK